MRRIDGARELRSWVEREVERARDAATEGMHDLRGRWDAELTRLQSLERKLLRLQEQVSFTVFLFSTSRYTYFEITRQTPTLKLA